MMNVLVRLATALAVASSAALAQSPIRQGGVVAVRVVAGGDTVFGNGVVVGALGTVVTERTLLEGAASISVLADSTRAVAATVVRNDSTTGLAVLRAPGLEVEPIAVASRALVAGDRLRIVMLALGARPTVHESRVQRVEKFDGVDLVDIVFALPPEMNGAPALNAAGELAAVAFRSDDRTLGILARHIGPLLGEGVVATRSAPPAEAPRVPTARAQAAPNETGGRPRLTFARAPKSRVANACVLALSLNLNGPATTGDVDQACACVDNAFAAADAGIPEEYRHNHLWMRPEGEVVNVDAINNTSSADLVPGPVKVVAERLSWEVRLCFGVLNTRGQLTGTFARDWSPEVRENSLDYRGPIVTPTNGPPRAVDQSLGGLAFTRLGYFSYTLWELTIGSGLEYTVRDRAWKEMVAVDSTAKDFVVLNCHYRVQAANGYNRNMSSRGYYYWYAPSVPRNVEAIAQALPAEHPIRKVRPARDVCPVRQPSS